MLVKKAVQPLPAQIDTQMSQKLTAIVNDPEFRQFLRARCLPDGVRVQFVHELKANLVLASSLEEMSLGHVFARNQYSGLR